MTENYVTGYPPPPYYYLEYEGVCFKGRDVDEKDNKNENDNSIAYKENAKNWRKKARVVNLENLLVCNGTKNDDTDKTHRIDESREMDESLLNNMDEGYSIYDINKMKNELLIEEHKKKIETYNKENSVIMFGRPPPNVIKNNYTVFGVNYDITKKIENLDPDDLLYDDKKNLKEEFIRLYKNYRGAFFELFDDIVNNRKNEKSKMKHLMKIHTNLFHILANLRYHQTVNNIINVLKIQLKRRQIAIDKMKISLLNVYQYINYVQTNFAQDESVKSEKKDLEKKKLQKKGFQKKKELKSIQN